MKENLQISLISEELGDSNGRRTVLPKADFERCVQALGLPSGEPRVSFSGDPNHPGVAIVRGILAELGVNIREGEGPTVEKPKVAFGHSLEFDSHDLDAAALLQVRPSGERIDRRLDEWVEDGRIVATASKIRQSVHVGGDDTDANLLFCSDAAKIAIEASGLRGYTFEPIEIAGKKVSAEHHTWLLGSSLTLPPIADGYLTDNFMASTDYPETGSCQPNVPWSPPFYRYGTDALGGLDGDVFQSLEKFGPTEIGRSRVTFVSAAFRQLCNNNKWKLDFRPVLVAP